jgi:hypothetical protein
MRGELGWYLTNEIGLRLSLSHRIADLLREDKIIDEKEAFINIFMGIIYNPQRRKIFEKEIIRINSEREKQARYAQAERAAQREAIEREYTEALETTGVVKLAEYIRKYKNSNFFNRESYIEIARRLSRNNNVRFIQLKSDQNADIANPYNFDSSAIYYCYQFTVQQWVGTSFLADISNGSNIGRDTRIFIRDIYNIGNIGRSVTNAYLRYVGVETYTAVSGAHTVVPKFDLLFSF